MTLADEGQQATLVVAHESPSVRSWIALAVRGLGDIREIDRGGDVERLALSAHPPSLAIVSATLADKTGTQVLAAARAAGRTTPFVVVSEFSEGHVLALVSEAQGTRASRRVLGRHGLRSLALRLLAQSSGSNR